MSSSFSSSTNAARAAAPPRKRYAGLVLIVLGVVIVGAMLGVLAYEVGPFAVGWPLASLITYSIAIGLAIMIVGAVVAISGTSRIRPLPQANASRLKPLRRYREPLRPARGLP